MKNSLSVKKTEKPFIMGKGIKAASVKDIINYMEKIKQYDLLRASFGVM